MFRFAHIWRETLVNATHNKVSHIQKSLIFSTNILTCITVAPFASNAGAHKTALTLPRPWQRSSPVVHGLVVARDPPGVGLEGGITYVMTSDKVYWTIKENSLRPRNILIFAAMMIKLSKANNRLHYLEVLILG